MDIRSTMKYARISSLKVRDLAKVIRGLSASEALNRLEFSHRKGAFLIAKTLKSAIANAENNAKLSAESMFVKEAVVQDGPSLKRHWPRARGSASPILKRMSHIKIVLSDEGKGGKQRIARKESGKSGTKG